MNKVLGVRARSRRAPRVLGGCAYRHACVKIGQAAGNTSRRKVPRVHSIRVLRSTESTSARLVAWHQHNEVPRPRQSLQASDSTLCKSPSMCVCVCVCVWVALAVARSSRWVKSFLVFVRGALTRSPYPCRRWCRWYPLVRNAHTISI